MRCAERVGVARSGAGGVALCPVVVAALWLLAAPPAFGFEHRCPAPGTELVTTAIQAANLPPIRYEGASGLWCLRSQGGKPIDSELDHFNYFPRDVAQIDLYERRVLREKSLRAAAALWPLVPGNHASFVYAYQEDLSGGGSISGRQFFFTQDLAVEMPRQIRVPAGQFLVIPIVVTIRGQGGQYHQSVRTYYYAPDLATNVKFEYRLVAGNQATPPPSWELVSIRQPATGDPGDGGGSE